MADMIKALICNKKGLEFPVRLRCGVTSYVASCYNRAASQLRTHNYHVQLILGMFYVTLETSVDAFPMEIKNYAQKFEKITTKAIFFFDVNFKVWTLDN